MLRYNVFRDKPMLYEIKTISNIGVNCYLLKTGDAFFMVDTGYALSRRLLKRTLAGAGCKPGDLKLIILTHGDTDHTGNCIFLREKYGAKIAIHRSEAGTVEAGNLLANRKTRRGPVFSTMLAINRKITKNKFKPDILVTDGDDLTPYGLDAKIVHTPGHTIGSISVLTAEGDFFCGDFLTNSGKPKINSFIDDPAEMNASASRLKNLNINKVYPGHGKPFLMNEFLENNR